MLMLFNYFYFGSQCVSTYLSLQVRLRIQVIYCNSNERKIYNNKKNKVLDNLKENKYGSKLFE